MGTGCRVGRWNLRPGAVAKVGRRYLTPTILPAAGRDPGANLETCDSN
jgi:hypothetical protein